jgi:hypothetical protein
MIAHELVVMHADGAMPDEALFCPSIWQADDFDSDGDFYADSLQGRWTQLRLERRVRGRRGTVLWVSVLRDPRPFEPWTVIELQGFIDRHRAGSYAHIPALAGLADLAVTALVVETDDPADHREFLESAHRFLRFTGGWLVDPVEDDADGFAGRFLAGPPR